MNKKQIICIIVIISIVFLLYKLSEPFAPVCAKEGLLRKTKCRYCGIDSGLLQNTGVLTSDQRSALTVCPEFLRDCNSWVESQGPDYVRAVNMLKPNWKQACFRDGPKIFDLYSKPGSLKLAAEELLKTKSEPRYDYLCGIVFEEGMDKATNDQYLSMKKTRPKAEVNNLCGNVAKNLLSRK